MLPGSTSTPAHAYPPRARRPARSSCPCRHQRLPSRRTCVFPELERRMSGVKANAGDDMGMSYELADAHVADMRAQVWTLTRATFTGAAILLREKAAYRNTSFQLRRRCNGRTAA